MKHLRSSAFLLMALTLAACDPASISAPEADDALSLADGFNKYHENSCRECGVDIVNIVRSWEGTVTFEDKMSGDRVTGTVLLEVTSQEATHFEGILRYSVPSNFNLPVKEFEIDGTITPNSGNTGSRVVLEGSPIFGVQFSTEIGPIVILTLHAQYDDTGAVPTIEGWGKYVVSDPDSEGNVSDHYLSLDQGIIMA